MSIFVFVALAAVMAADAHVIRTEPALPARGADYTIEMYGDKTPKGAFPLVHNAPCVCLPGFKAVIGQPKTCTFPGAAIANGGLKKQPKRCRCERLAVNNRPDYLHEHLDWHGSTKRVCGNQATPTVKGQLVNGQTLTIFADMPNAEPASQDNWHSGGPRKICGGPAKVLCPYPAPCELTPNDPNGFGKCVSVPDHKVPNLRDAVRDCLQKQQPALKQALGNSGAANAAVGIAGAMQGYQNNANYGPQGVQAKDGNSSLGSYLGNTIQNQLAGAVDNKLGQKAIAGLGGTIGVCLDHHLNTNGGVAGLFTQATKGKYRNWGGTGIDLGNVISGAVNGATKGAAGGSNGSAGHAIGSELGGLLANVVSGLGKGGFFSSTGGGNAVPGQRRRLLQTSPARRSLKQFNQAQNQEMYNVFRGGMAIDPSCSCPNGYRKVDPLEFTCTYPGDSVKPDADCRCVSINGENPWMQLYAPEPTPTAPKNPNSTPKERRSDFAGHMYCSTRDSDLTPENMRRAPLITKLGWDKNSASRLQILGNFPPSIDALSCTIMIHYPANENAVCLDFELLRKAHGARTGTLAYPANTYQMAMTGIDPVTGAPIGGFVGDTPKERAANRMLLFIGLGVGGVVVLGLLMAFTCSTCKRANKQKLMANSYHVNSMNRDTMANFRESPLSGTFI
jgi:hypothetical protein